MKYLILGAGPAGLTFANKLLEFGERSFLVLEKENSAGGLCRSMNVDGAPIDIGGGHFLDVRRKNVNQFLFQFMPEEEWNLYNRDSRISLQTDMIAHPIEANIWQMSLEKQVEYLKSIALAGCNLGEPKPEKFIDWIYWKLGEKIAQNYMIPYNKKIFCEELNALGTYWLEKLPNVSFEETLLSCLTSKPYGSQPGHAKFYYPKKYGYGEIWIRMARNLGDKIKYDTKISVLDSTTNSIFDELGEKYAADIIINTIPWNSFNEISGMPENIKANIKKLKHSSIQIEYFPENMKTDAQWIYYPSEELSYHRILLRHNFCSNSKGYWTETNSKRVIGNKNFTFLNQYAYPLNTIEKPAIMNELLEWAKKCKIYGLGRWGEHQHYNSDVTVDLALGLAEKFNNEIL